MRQPIRYSIRWYLERYPQNEHEPNYKYYERIQGLAKEDGYEYGYKSILNAASKYRKYYQTVNETLDKNGNVVGSKVKLQTSNQVDTSNATVKHFTTYNGDPKWVRYEVDPNPPPEITSQFIEEFIGRINLIDKKPKLSKKRKEDRLRLAIHSDNHTGMETDAKATAMYGFVWNGEEHMKRKDIFEDKVIGSYQGEKELHILNLGDHVDGWDGFTTRKGHKLPQNMDNAEAFIYGGKFIIESADRIQKETNAKVTIHSVVNSNHGGSFEKIVNVYARDILKERNPFVTYNIHEKFLNHYLWQNFCFVLTHGKDEEFRKKPLPTHLDKATIQFLSNYIKQKRLYDYKTVVIKGDGHRQAHDFDSTPDFDYMCMRAFSPASQYGETNFTSVASGFSIATARAGERHLTVESFEFDA